MKVRAASFRSTLLFALLLAASFLPSRAFAQSTSDSPSGYGRTLTVAQASTNDFGAGLDMTTWWSVAVTNRVADLGSRELSRGKGVGSAWTRPAGRSGERAGRWRSQGLASARSAGR